MGVAARIPVRARKQNAILKRLMEFENVSIPNWLLEAWTKMTMSDVLNLVLDLGGL